MALAFTPACAKAGDQPEVKAYGLFRSFLRMCPALSMCIAFSIPLNAQELFQTLFPKCINPQLFLPGFYMSVVCPNCLSTSLKNLLQTATSALLEGPELGDTKANPLLQSFREPPNRPKHTNTSPWEQGPLCCLQIKEPTLGSLAAVF